MSIWAPWATVGYEEPRPGRPRSRCPAVLSYAEGWPRMALKWLSASQRTGRDRRVRFVSRSTAG